MAVISISRQFGAGGKELGKQIAHKLEYCYADEDILEKAAVEVHVSPEWEKNHRNGIGRQITKIYFQTEPLWAELNGTPFN